MNLWILIGLVLVPAVHLRSEDATPTTCTYQTWDWNVKRKRSERHRKVQKPYSEITAVERDESGCTVCQEDQAWIRIDGLPAFQICKKYEADVTQTMKAIQASGFPIETIVSYRVGKTKGGPDAKGFRTQFSRHSFGIAVDLNDQTNGLYTDCHSWGPSCKLLRGGPWKIGDKTTITADSTPVVSFKAMGWGWGGELVGRQKDFMHFSLYGD